MPTLLHCSRVDSWVVGQMFFLEEGQAEASVHGAVVMSYAVGDCFGELALLTGQPRLATIVANDSLEVLAIDRDVLKSLRETLPTLEDEIIRNLRRFDHMDSFITMSIA